MPFKDDVYWLASRDSGSLTYVRADVGVSCVLLPLPHAKISRRNTKHQWNRIKMEAKRLCGDSSGPSIFSVLAAAHLAGAGVIVYLTACTRDARSLRLVNRELKDAVSLFPWRDSSTVISGSVAAWSTSFSHAQAANLRGRCLTMGDAEQLTGVPELNLAESAGEAVLLGLFARCCASLTSLNLSQRSYCPLIVFHTADLCVQAVAKNCPQLITLDVG